MKKGMLVRPMGLSSAVYLFPDPQDLLSNLPGLGRSNGVLRRGSMGLVVDVFSTSTMFGAKLTLIRILVGDIMGWTSLHAVEVAS